MEGYREYYQAYWNVMILRASDVKMFRQKRTDLANARQKIQKDLDDANSELAGFSRRQIPINRIINSYEAGANLDSYFEQYGEQNISQLLAVYRAKKLAEERLANLYKDAYAGTQKWPLSGLIQDLRLERKANELDELALGFYDPNQRIVTSIKTLDYIYAVIGWRGADNERYRPRLQFIGVVTNKQTQISGSGASKSQITCNDERILLGDKKENDVKDMMEDSQFIFDMLRDIMPVEVQGDTLERSKHIIYNESKLQKVTDKAKANGLVMFTKTEDSGTDSGGSGETVCYFLPWDQINGEVYEAIWSPTRKNEVGNILDFQFSESHKQETDEGQEGGEGEPVDPSNPITPELDLGLG